MSDLTVDQRWLYDVLLGLWWALQHEVAYTRGWQRRQAAIPRALASCLLRTA